MKGVFNRRMAGLLILLMLCALAPYQAFADEDANTGVSDWVSEFSKRREAELAANSDGLAATDGVYAILYADGTLALQSNDTPKEGRAYTTIYPLDMTGYDSAEDIPWYADRDAITTVNIASEIAPESVAYWFMNCANLQEVEGVDNLRMNRATTMRNMFHGCTSLRELNLDVDATKRWYTIRVTDMSGLFYGCTALTELNLSVLKTPALENLEDAFAGCTRLKKLSLVRWDMSNVTNLKGMLKGCTRLMEVDMTGCDTSGVTDMSEMFCQCEKLAAIHASDTFVTEQVTQSSDMFSGCSALKGGNGTAYSASHTDKTYARIDAGTGTPGYFSVGVFAILYADGTLAFQYGDTPDGREALRIFPVDMTDKYVFEAGTGNVNAPWLFDTDCRDSIIKADFVDVISPVKPRYWFYNCTTLEEVLHSENLDLSRATEINDMFYNCTSLRSVDVSSWDTSNIVEGHAIFYCCGSLTGLDVSGWNTSNMKNMSGMFYGCSSVPELDVSGFDTGRVTTFSSMFRDCVRVTELDVSNWDTSSVQQTGGMFYGCTGLTELDLSNWDTSQCFYCGEMFSGATNLKTIWASEKLVLDVPKLMENYEKRGTNVFADCPALVGSNGTAYDPDCTDYTYLRLDAPGAPGYLSRKTLRLSDALPLTQDNAPIGLAALGSLSAIRVRLASANEDSTNATFVAAFYDGGGRMLRAFLARATVEPEDRIVTIPASGVSGDATELRVFALSAQYAPLTASRCFQLD